MSKEQEMFTVQQFATDVLAAQGDHSEASKLLVGSVCVVLVVGVLAYLGLRSKN